MNVNRNTINSDLKFAYSKLSSEMIHDDFYAHFMKQMYRFEIQRTRLLEELKKQNGLKEKLAIEKMVLEIDTKILIFHQRLSESAETILYSIIGHANDLVNNTHWMKSGFVNLRDARKTSDGTRDKINKLIVEDEKKKPVRIGF